MVESSIKGSRPKLILKVVFREDLALLDITEHKPLTEMNREKRFTLLTRFD